MSPKKRNRRKQPPSVASPSEEAPGTVFRLRPWASFVLGFRSYSVRTDQLLFWQGARGYVHDDDYIRGLLNSLDNLRQAAIILASEISQPVLGRLAPSIEEISRLSDEMLTAYAENGSCDGRAFGEGETPGDSHWRTLRILADQALSTRPLKDWCSLGCALGWFEYSALTGAVDRDPEVRGVVDAAAALGEQSVQQIPELLRLLGFSARRDPLVASEVFAIANGHSYDPNTTSAFNEFLTLMVRTVVGLRELPPAEVDPAKTSAEPPTLLTDLQKHILAALDGKALKVEALARECCAGDTSRLYKPGGLRELKELRLVCHQRMVGYFRADAPPLDGVPVRRTPLSRPRTKRNK